MLYIIENLIRRWRCGGVVAVWCNATISQSISVLVSSGGRAVHSVTPPSSPPSWSPEYSPASQPVSRISIFHMFGQPGLAPPVTALLVPRQSRPWHACSSWVWGETVEHLQQQNWSEIGWVAAFLQMSLPPPPPPAPPTPSLCQTWGGQPGRRGGRVPSWPWWPLSVQCSAVQCSTVGPTSW